MISYQAARKGVVKNMPEGFIPYEYKTVGGLAQVICHYTWSPIIFNEEHRKAKNFLYADLCVLDIDNDKPELPICTIEDIKREFCDCKMIIGTTKSHQISKNGKPPQDRFRVILQFDRRVTSRGEYQATMESMMRLFDFLDDSCKDAGRQFFPCKQIVHVQGEGETIPISPYDPIMDHPSQIKFDEIRKRRGGLSKNVIAFLDHGTIFEGGRNNSIFHSARNLLQMGINLTDALKLISEAPFDRSKDWKEKELYNTVTGVYKRGLQA